MVRSIRITKELDDLIRKDAKNAGGTVNALISSILTRYAEWDRYVERLGFVTIPREGFRLLVDALDEKDLVEFAENFGPSASREMALIWFKEVNLETFLRYLSMQSRYGGLQAFEVDGGAKADTITLHHNLGPRYSRLLSRFIKQTLGSLTNISPRLSVEENALAIHFPPGTLAESWVA